MPDYINFYDFDLPTGRGQKKTIQQGLKPKSPKKKKPSLAQNPKPKAIRKKPRKKKPTPVSQAHRKTIYRSKTFRLHRQEI